MIEISGSQLGALSGTTQQNFRDEMAELLGIRFPDSGDDDAKRRADVDAACEEAKELGLISREDTRSWIMLRAVHGPYLARLDWVKPVLEDSLLTPGERLSVIDERAVRIEAASIGAKS